MKHIANCSDVLFLCRKQKRWVGSKFENKKFLSVTSNILHNFSQGLSLSTPTTIEGR